MLEIQGHRGARGLAQENTLPSFELALDVGVDSIETDLHLTKDGVIVLFHDFYLPNQVAISESTLAQLRQMTWQPQPLGTVTALAQTYAKNRDMDVWAIPTLQDLFRFVRLYAEESGKSVEQRASAQQVLLDLEIKALPFSQIPSPFLIEQLLPIILDEHWLERCRVRSFDHRLVQQILQKEPGLTGGLLVAGTCPLDPVRMCQKAGANIYCPDYRFVTLEQVQQLQEQKIRVIPWTVNAEVDWKILCNWGIDGITTDRPDRLRTYLASQHSNQS